MVTCQEASDTTGKCVVEREMKAQEQGINLGESRHTSDILCPRRKGAHPGAQVLWKEEGDVSNQLPVLLPSRQVPRLGKAGMALG